MIDSKVAYHEYVRTIDKNNLYIDLSEDDCLGEGTTRSDNGQLIFSSVGIDKLFLQNEISDCDFASGMVAIFHENRHIEQLNEIHQSAEEYTKPLKYSYYAMQCCVDYGVDNYFISSREIEAELYGMHHAYCYCVDVFGKEKSDELLCNYVNNRIQKGISFVHRDSKNYRYNNVDDIFIDMSKAYADSVYTQREITQPIKDFLHDSPYMLQRLEHEKIEYKQDKMMASLYLGQTRNKYLYSLPGLSKIDWSHETNFLQVNL